MSGACALIEAPFERLYRLEHELYSAVPPIDPPPLYWLHSDAGYSYCWPCARAARWNELPSAGPVPEEVPFYRGDFMEDLIREGIDGGFDGGDSDSSEACEICRCTLRHTLSDYGLQDELAHFAEHPGWGRVNGEDTYTISRICLNLTWEGAPAGDVAAAIEIVEAALEYLAGKGMPEP